MKLWGCNHCHHEWEGAEDTCDWCGGPGYVLEETTPLAQLVQLVGTKKKEESK